LVKIDAASDDNFDYDNDTQKSSVEEVDKLDAQILKKVLQASLLEAKLKDAQPKKKQTDMADPSTDSGEEEVEQSSSSSSSTSTSVQKKKTTELVIGDDEDGLGGDTGGGESLPPFPQDASLSATALHSMFPNVGFTTGHSPDMTNSSATMIPQNASLSATALHSLFATGHSPDMTNSSATMTPQNVPNVPDGQQAKCNQQ
jgi:hypothetical protein